MNTPTEKVVAMLTPDQQLATLIVEDLVGDGTARKERMNQLIADLSNGKMKSEDWRTLIAASLHAESTKSEGQQ